MGDSVFDYMAKWIAVGMCLSLIALPLIPGSVYHTANAGYYIGVASAIWGAYNHDYVGMALGIISWHLALLSLAAGPAGAVAIGIAL